MTTTTTKTPADFMRKDQWGEEFVAFDELAAALAPVLGGTVGECEPGKYGQGRIELDGYRLAIRGARPGPADKIEVAAWLNEASGLHYSDRTPMPSAGMSLSKGLDAVVRDIRNRVMAKTAEPLAETRAKVERMNEARARLELAAAGIADAFPAMSVKLPPEKHATSADLYAGPSFGTYLSGNLYADGSVTIQRLGNLNAKQARAVLAAIRDNAES